MSQPTPFFSKPEDYGSRCRLLLLSWHFPPGQSAGALRWQKMSRFVSERGYGLDVITIDPSMLTARDESRLAELPAGTRVFGVKPPSTLIASIDARRSTIRAASTSTSTSLRPSAGERSRAKTYRPSQAARVWNSLIQFDADLAWARVAVQTAAALVTDAHAALITCGPPHTVHALGMELARRRRIPGIMDMRDPWASRRRVPEALDTPLWFWIADFNERRAVARSSLVVANTDALAAALRGAHPTARVITVMNGCDEEELPTVARGDRFVLAYAGAIYIDRDPSPLFRAVALAARRLGVGPERLGIELVGRVASFAGRSLEAIANEVGARDFVRLSPPVPRVEALRFLASAQMLVSLPQDSQFAIPSKIFEYMAYPAWILVMAGQGSPAATLLEGTTADVVAPDDVEGMAAVIEQRAQEYWNGGVPARLADQPRFSRRHHANVLLDTLEQLSGSAQ